MDHSRRHGPESVVATEPAGLSRCQGCGSTLTGAFRFCPGCGRPGDDYGWPQSDAAISFPIVERADRLGPDRTRAAGRSTRRLLGSTAHASHRLGVRASKLGQPLWRGALGVAGALADTGRFLVEVVVVCAGSVRSGVRSMVLLQRLHARRAALVQAAGYAALAGESRRIEFARSEVRMLDELIVVASGRMLASDWPAATSAVDAPTDENVLRSR